MGETAAKADRSAFLRLSLFGDKTSSGEPSLSAPPEIPAASPSPSKRELVDYIAAGSKPVGLADRHRAREIRLRPEDLRTVSYEAPNGIAAIFEGMLRFGWEPIEEHGNVIAPQQQAGRKHHPGAGRQFELSGRPCNRSIRPAPKWGT